MKIVGFKLSRFTPKNGTVPIDGKTFFVTEPIKKEYGEGESVDRFFLNAEKLDALDFVPAIGQTVTPLYNKYGSVVSLHLDDDSIDF